MKKVLCFLTLASLGFAGCSKLRETEMAIAPSAAVPAVAADQEVAKPEKAVRLVSAPADTATLKLKFILDGDVPKREEVDGSRDPFCADLEILSEKMVVSKAGEIQNVVLYLDTRKTKVDLPNIPVPDVKPVLDNKGCVFVPHVFAVRAGQTVIVKNSDEAGHNANFNFFNNPSKNFLVPAGGSKELEIKQSEPTAIPVDCNIHPWMKSHIIVMDHPFVGISNEKGELEIKDLPVGEVAFKIWHENSDRSLEKGELNGKSEKWSRGVMKVELKPGMNDLGTIKFKADSFK